MAVVRSRNVEADFAHLRANTNRIQGNAFTGWVNSHLAERGTQIPNLRTGFTDGIALVQLLEVLSGHSIPYNDNCKFKLHRLANLEMALDVLKQEGLDTFGIGPMDIEAGHATAILGLVWQILLRYQGYQTGDVSAGNPRAVLLSWVQQQLQDTAISREYELEDLDNFSADIWREGPLLCALLNSLSPTAAVPAQGEDPLEVALHAMEAHFGSMQPLSAEDVRLSGEKTMMALVAQILALSRRRPQSSNGASQPSLSPLSPDSLSDSDRARAEWGELTTEQQEDETETDFDDEDEGDDEGDEDDAIAAATAELSSRLPVFQQGIDVFFHATDPKDTARAPGRLLINADADDGATVVYARSSDSDLPDGGMQSLQIAKLRGVRLGAVPVHPSQKVVEEVVEEATLVLEHEHGQLQLECASESERDGLARVLCLIVTVLGGGVFEQLRSVFPPSGIDRLTFEQIGNELNAERKLWGWGHVFTRYREGDAEPVLVEVFLHKNGEIHWQGKGSFKQHHHMWGAFPLTTMSEVLYGRQTEAFRGEWGFDSEEDLSFSLCFPGEKFTLDLEAPSEAARVNFLKALVALRAHKDSIVHHQTNFQFAVAPLDVDTGRFFASDELPTPLPSAPVEGAVEGKSFGVTIRNVEFTSSPVVCVYVSYEKTLQQLKDSVTAGEDDDERVWTFVDRTEWIRWGPNDKFQFRFAHKFTLPSGEDDALLRFMVHNIPVDADVEESAFTHEPSECQTLLGFTDISVGSLLTSAARPRILLDFTNHNWRVKPVPFFVLKNQYDLAREEEACLLIEKNRRNAASNNVKAVTSDISERRKVSKDIAGLLGNRKPLREQIQAVEIQLEATSTVLTQMILQEKFDLCAGLKRQRNNIAEQLETLRELERAQLRKQLKSGNLFVHCGARWKQRRVRLFNDIITWDSEDTATNGRMALNNLKSMKEQADPAFTFILSGKDKQLAEFAADSTEMQQEWMASIEAAATARASVTSSSSSASLPSSSSSSSFQKKKQRSRSSVPRRPRAGEGAAGAGRESRKKRGSGVVSAPVTPVRKRRELSTAKPSVNPFWALFTRVRDATRAGSGTGSKSVGSSPQPIPRPPANVTVLGGSHSRQASRSSKGATRSQAHARQASKGHARQTSTKSPSRQTSTKSPSRQTSKGKPPVHIQQI